MSKGLGRIQQAILAILAEREVSNGIDLAGAIYEENPVSRAHVEAVNRAVRKLIASGHVVNLGRRHPDGRRLLALADSPAAAHYVRPMLSLRHVSRIIDCAPATVARIRRDLAAKRKAQSNPSGC